MQAIVYREFGSPDVLRCEEMEKPAPRKGEVLVRVRAAGLNPLDWRLMEVKPLLLRALLGLHKTKRPGVDVAGVVEAVGEGAGEFRAGDAVFGLCRGALAEYACAPAATLARKPEGTSYEEAAAVPVAGLTALQGLRDKGRVQPGQRVLINGAAGGVGTFAVQIAKWMGAEVTGVCSGAGAELVRRLGADYAIDYAQQDFTRGGRKYDVIVDCVANHKPEELRCVLEPRGICVLVGAPKDVGIFSMLGGLALLALRAPFSRQKMMTMMAKRRQADLATLADLMRSGQVKPVIDRCYGMADCAAAMRHLETMHAHGKVVVAIGG
jgi:NADPH:quinone reductase-like Zn-dependent oxidoreductase